MEETEAVLLLKTKLVFGLTFSFYIAPTADVIMHLQYANDVQLYLEPSQASLLTVMSECFAVIRR
jgi:hypothetical protein